ncbi:hypothetical protein GCM10009677_17230 [Sphaerisporangium rubeum]|uniref:DUF3073 domain-containing protein n=1 Tax=Sphaerisporangium rubeum TaxID=321317 RepID=A0A7X0MAB1_9ACTN|nr:DUF3073 family protein [Sphaerisporangium rubeum]MBB6475806.1 hypothetical protein [Sphaerisporangium rubeum]
MGRGRAKAKQVKVARALKYSGGGDLEALRRELNADRTPSPHAEPDDVAPDAAAGPAAGRAEDGSE